MTAQLHYGTPAKIVHWLIVALLLIQFPIGWLMPDVHAGPPGGPMTFHVSFGILILAVIVLRVRASLKHDRFTVGEIDKDFETFRGKNPELVHRDGC